MSPLPLSSASSQRSSQVSSSLSQSALLQFAIDMADSLSAKDRFNRLLNTVRGSIPCDAVVLLQRTGSELKPLAQKGLGADALGRRFEISSHPRFDAICSASAPVRFQQTCGLPDPYDGMLKGFSGDLPVHACMGLPLLSDNRLIGVLTLDSMTPGIFDDIPEHTLEVISAMAAASLKTAMLLQHLEDDSTHRRNVICELTQEALTKDGGELMGESEVMKALKRELALVAPSDYAVLIEGETGVGKELVARTLHGQSRRAKGPLVYVNCAAMPENLVESELFGHVKGAFTGADRNREGKFGLADGGTLFLDEIGELPLAAQSKLLRVLQSQEIQPVGQDQISQVDVRVIAATNRVLQEEVAQKRFRADLYHRLSVYPVTVPPLRARDGDVALLAGYFLELSRRKLGLQQLLLEDNARQVLERYNWPGNVRELEHVIGRAALIANAESMPSVTANLEEKKKYALKARTACIECRHLGDIAVDSILTSRTLINRPLVNNPSVDYATSDQVLMSGLTSKPKTVQSLGFTENNPSFAVGYSLKQMTETYQRNILMQYLEKEHGNWAATARLLGMDRANLMRLAKRLDIQVIKKIDRR